MWIVIKTLEIGSFVFLNQGVRNKGFEEELQIYFKEWWPSWLGNSTRY